MLHIYSGTPRVAISRHDLGRNRWLIVALLCLATVLSAGYVEVVVEALAHPSGPLEGNA